MFLTSVHVISEVKQMKQGNNNCLCLLTCFYSAPKNTPQKEKKFDEIFITKCHFVAQQVVKEEEWC